MKLELHLLQNFAPSCLNRDDTNSPKDCEFGGFRRARISSQCLKRAIRGHFSKTGFLTAGELAHRSKRLIEEVGKRLADKHTDSDEVRKAVTSALAAVKLQADDEGKTQYLLFLSEREVAALAALVDKHWDALKQVKLAGTEGADGKKKTAKQQKAAAKDALPKEVAESVVRLFDGGGAADLALFGRMLADQKSLSVDAACQVAHALSTNRVAMELDYYTAVDDLKPDDNTGADMIGTVEFNSSCFYRYANIDLCELKSNLLGKKKEDATPQELAEADELVGKTVTAFIRASIEAIPTGKQNSMAAQNPPDFVLAVVRNSGLWSLANAFVKPIRPDDGDLVGKSIHALDRYWGKVVAGFGNDGLVATPYWTTLDDDLAVLDGKSRVKSVAALIAQVESSINGAKA